MSDDDANPHITATIESLMRVTLAGFGGALAGISISRRGGLAASQHQAQTLAKKAITSNNVIQQKTRTQRRQAIRSSPPVLRPSIDRELPSAWAVACMAFAGVVEFTRLVSPTTFVSQFITPPLKLESDDDDGVQVDAVVQADDDAIVLNNPDAMKYGSTIIDYMIGGGIAGALFKGSAVRTPTGARLDASIMGNYSASSVSTAMKGKPLSGILPGAALGLLAGVTIVTMEYAQVVIEEKFGVEEDDDEAEVTDDVIEEVVPKKRDDDIPADIKAMTSEELAASIQSLRSGRAESNEDKRVEDEPQEERSNATEDKEATDLLYSIGFRPHQS
eukprot:scaffold14952_cov85-Skeletonema_dohrnii-CCMP3373.AAC.1